MDWVQQYDAAEQVAWDNWQQHVEECLGDCGTCHDCGAELEASPYFGGVYSGCGDCLGGTDRDPYVNVELMGRWQPDHAEPSRRWTR